jgi:transcriptional regulator with XRE-family HTH domain
MDILSALRADRGDIQAMEIGDRIRMARRTAGLTQVQLAERLGVDKSAVAQWESHNSRKGITVTNLVRVAEILAVSLPELTGDNTGDGGLLVNDTAEAKLVRLYRQMTAEQQTMFLEFLAITLRIAKPEKPQSNPSHGKRIAS